MWIKKELEAWTYLELGKHQSEAIFGKWDLVQVEMPCMFHLKPFYIENFLFSFAVITINKNLLKCCFFIL